MMRNPEIQLVDDKPENLRFLKTILAKKGYMTRTCINGRLALASATEQPPDLILMDIRMPGMSGYEVCRKLKSIEKTCRIPVIFLSVLNNLKDKVDAFTTGGVDYINKPFQEEEVLARVATHLSLRNAQILLEKQNRLLQKEIEERRRVEEELRKRTCRLRDLATRLAEAQEIERRNLSRELHDRLGQTVSILGINMKIIRDLLPEGREEITRLEDSSRMLEEMTENIRNIVGELRPLILDDCGLFSALRWYGDLFFRRTGIPVSINGDRDVRFRSDAETAFFRIAQEALTNVAKHARAGSVTITFLKNGNTGSLRIADDGTGFYPENKGNPGLGLVAMKERLSAMGGHLAIDSVSGKGTAVIAEIPLGNIMEDCL